MVDLVKLPEDLPLVGLGDADPGVGHRYLHRVLEARRRQAHRAALRCEFDRVGDEVEQHLFELPGIRQHLARAIDLGLELDVLLADERFHRLDDLVDDIGNRDGLQAELHLSRLDLRQVQDVVDQAQQVLAAREDLAQEPGACCFVELAVASVGEQLGESDDRVEGRAQLVAHVGQEHALVAVRLQQGRVALLELDDEMTAVECRHERAKHLLHAGHLVGTEARSERAGQDDESPRGGQTAHRKLDHAGFVATEGEAAHTFRDLRELAAQLADLRRIDASARAGLARRVIEDGRGAAAQPHRPLERAVGEGVPVLGEQELLHEGAQAFLFLCSPLPAEPSRRREAGVEERHDGEDRELDRHLNRDLPDEHPDRDGKQQDHDQAAESETQRAQAPGLYSGKASCDQPETDDRLADAYAPDEDPCDCDAQHHISARADSLGGEEEDAGSRQRNGRDDMPAPREGDKDVSVAKERVSRAGEPE